VGLARSQHPVFKVFSPRGDVPVPFFNTLLGAAIWAAAPIAGAWLATRIGHAHHWARGIVAGAILLALAGLNMAMLPYPIWIPIVIVVTFPLGTILGVRLAKSPRIGQHSGG
jgi:hypothetical protein